MAEQDDSSMFDFSGMDEDVQNSPFASFGHQNFMPDFSVGNMGAGHSLEVSTMGLLSYFCLYK